MILESYQFRLNGPGKAANVYSGFDTVRPDKVEQIKRYPHWRNGIVMIAGLGLLKYYADLEDPDSWSMKLTQGGKKRNLSEVVALYPGLRNTLDVEFVTQVDKLIRLYGEGYVFPPVYLARGRNPFKSPFILDGMHRLLAMGLVVSQNPDIKIKQSAWLGAPWPTSLFL